MTTGKIVLIVFSTLACLALVVTLVCAGFLYVGYSTTESDVSPKIEQMFSAIDQGSFADTYQPLTSQELKDTASKEQYAALGELIATRLGKLQSKSLESFAIKQLLSGSQIDVSYNAVFEKGKGTITAKLKKQSGEWRFVSFRVNSPAFLKDDVKEDASQE
ncbi:hypothetical protein LF1_01690 [Rubripirellula obstinata]|uniref:Lumazine-binding domain protein n=1 Tax=Rubripirellula obstinata TaxID=406547 RepID=A0A5B1CBR9_9BACT|nr:DUF4019 domain-containing protein [Rubripirellula obstinata]KAA1257681.1 hypothetical protein LF1_01690 [Rubripirellula obstinata]